MEQLLAYFSNIPSSVRAAILIGGVVFFWVLEGMLPRFSFKYKKVRHAGINLLFTLCTAIIGFAMAGVLLYASDWAIANNFGLLNLVELPLWLKVLVGVMLLDLIGAYFVHWTEHKVKWMWKFHLVHHTDTTVDVTTGLRHHPGETVFRLSFTILAAFIVGAPMGIIMLYQSLSVLFAHLTHANIAVPTGFDKFLSLLFVTPNMHKVHHHYTQPYTDSNYGNIFSIWDRLFGTFRSMDASKLVYGIDTHMDPLENDRLGNLFKIPFQTYRTPTGSKFGES